MIFFLLLIWAILAAGRGGETTRCLNCKKLVEKKFIELCCECCSGCCRCNNNKNIKSLQNKKLFLQEQEIEDNRVKSKWDWIGWGCMTFLFAPLWLLFLISGWWVPFFITLCVLQAIIGLGIFFWGCIK